MKSVTSSVLLLLAGFVAGCSGPPTSPTEAPVLPAAIGPLPAGVIPPAFAVEGSTTCGSPSTASWRLVMATAGTNGARFHSVVAHSGNQGCVKTSEDQRVDNDLLAVSGTTAYAPHDSGATTFTYAASAFSCGSSQVTIMLTAADGRAIASVLDTMIDYGVTCGDQPPLPVPVPPGPNPSVPQPGTPPPPIPTPAPPPAPLGLVTTLTCTPAAHALPTACNVTAKYNGANVSSGAVTRIDWDWGDGTSHIVNGSPLDTRSYSQAGTYRVEANTTVNTTDGPKTAVSSTLLVIS